MNRHTITFSVQSEKNVDEILSRLALVFSEEERFFVNSTESMHLRALWNIEQKGKTSEENR